MLANNNAVIPMTGAPADVRRQVVRCDTLVDHIKSVDWTSRQTSNRGSFTRMRRRAEAWLRRSKPLQVDLADKYTIKPVRGEVAGTEAHGQGEQQEVAPVCPICGRPMQLQTALHGAHKSSSSEAAARIGLPDVRGS